MSKVICPQCNTAYTHTTEACPACGAHQKNKPVLSKQAIVAIVIADIMAILGLIAALLASGILNKH